MKENERIEPVFSNCDKAIVFAADDGFSPYLSVMLLSVLEHASDKNDYDIVVLHRNITLDNQKILLEMTNGKKNVSLRFCNVKSQIESFHFFTQGKDGMSIDTYLRLLIPYVLSDRYVSALYLDSDMLAMTDVYPLLETDLEGYLLASTRDMGGIADYYYPTGKRKQYRDNVLKISKPDDYFIAGMLVWNLPEFRKEWTQNMLLEFAASREWFQHDQDILNVICNSGRAKILHASWDVMKPYKKECLPLNLQKELEESIACPKILHFGGDEKPWKNTLSPWMKEFWDAAARSPFFLQIIEYILSQKPGTNNEIMLQRFAEGQIGLKYIGKSFMAWLKYKLK